MNKYVITIGNPTDCLSLAKHTLYQVFLCYMYLNNTFFPHKIFSRFNFHLNTFFLKIVTNTILSTHCHSELFHARGFAQPSKKKIKKTCLGFPNLPGVQHVSAQCLNCSLSQHISQCSNSLEVLHVMRAKSQTPISNPKVLA